MKTMVPDLMTIIQTERKFLRKYTMVDSRIRIVLEFLGTKSPAIPQKLSIPIW